MPKEMSYVYWKHPRIFPTNLEKIQKKKKISEFSGHEKNLSVKMDFATAHKQIHRIDFCIPHDLRKTGKLVRSQTNSQILRYLHF